MGCCTLNTGLIHETDYNKLAYRLLTSFPLTKCSSRSCKSQFKMTEIDASKVNNSRHSSKKLKSLSKQDLEYSEEKYLKVLENLFKMRVQDTNNASTKTLRRFNRNPTRTSTLKLLSLKDEKEFVFENERSEVFENKLNTTVNYEDSPVNKLYLSITPTFSELFETIIKDKPESSFYLFVLGFCKDSIESKSYFFIELCETAGLKLNLTAFRNLLQAYIDTNISFACKLYDAIRLYKTEELSGDILGKFDIKLSNQLLSDWTEHNSIVGKVRSLVSAEFINTVCKELVNLIETETTISSIETFKSKYRLRLDKFTVIEICELLLKNNTAAIEADHITMLQMLHPYLFNSAELFIWIKEKENILLSKSY